MQWLTLTPVRLAFVNDGRLMLKVVDYEVRCYFLLDVFLKLSFGFNNSFHPKFL